MTREGSFLDSRLSTQSRNGAGVVEISSDEDEVEDENAVRAAGPSKVHSTKPKILTNAKPSREKQKDKEAPAPAPAPAPAIVEQNIKSSPSDTSKPNSMAEVATQSRPTSTIFEEGSVQAKIAQIEKTAETEAGTGEDVVIDTVNVNANAQEDEDHDVQMAGPLAVEEGEQVKARPETEASEGAEAKVALPNHSRPAITPPRSQPQQQPPVSPFKTPFRLGPGNPFSVPPTPGVPMELALGVPIPLSKELFIPTRELSDAELNMTVEEWVRHHKQIEYEKFKEDGERKIDTFLRQAEQTRRAIEGL
ncbi:hypothetical protein BT96DRAFT_914079 [Gymnopus androsaceus JB14]|uniref:Uncharacterized protein n=1 Tax=Gymnopus androsaceus JB14 TaxID=1447944 RepID=A0A6A4IBR2_9AGAR|nr:hypothetical protein BT96DRAFT_914079 [Gymnopus androsaceus JB14]